MYTALSHISSGTTYFGGVSFLKSDAPDHAYEALENYASSLRAWIEKASALIELADPEGQWTFNDFHAGFLTPVGV